MCIYFHINNLFPNKHPSIHPRLLWIISSNSNNPLQNQSWLISIADDTVIPTSNPMLISIRITSDQIHCLIQKTKRIISCTMNIKLNLIAILTVYDIPDCFEILWFCFSSFCYYQMVFWTYQDILIPPWFHPTFTQITFFRRF